MSRKILALALSLCLVLSLAACSSGGSSEQSSQPQEPLQTQEPSSVESAESSEDVSAAPTDGQEPQEEETDASAEVNAYGVTDAALESLSACMKEHVTNDYLNVSEISPADFAWPDAEADFWGITCSLINLGNAAGSFAKFPDSLFETYTDEERPLGRALMAGIAEWEETEDGNFYTIASTLDEKDKVIAFFTENVTFE